MPSESKRSILITGCSAGGVGHDLALEFAARGLRVFATARSSKSLSSLEGKGIETFELDVTSEESIRALKAEIAKRTGGKLDILFNNAGTMYEAPAIEADTARIRTMFDTNVFGLFDMVSSFAPLLLASTSPKNKPPVIINTSSMLARLPFAFSAAYNASKAAVASYSDTLRIELEPLGIKVVTLFMGEVATKLMSPNNISFNSGSIYSDVLEPTKERSRNHAKNSMSPEEFARQVVEQILVKSPGHGKGEYLWKGTNAWVVWLLNAAGWRKIFDGLVKKMVSLDDRQVREAIFQKGRASRGLVKFWSWCANFSKKPTLMAEAKPDAPASRRRGRPRTVTEYEKAPDRRRNQLRVAQQAYRRRKETTIADLQTRVQELESGIEELSQSFVSFIDLLLEADVLMKYPHVTSAFHKIMQQCVSLARSGYDEPDQASLANAMLNSSRKLSATQNINRNYNPVVAEADALPTIDKTTQPSLATRNQWPVSRLPPSLSYQDQAILSSAVVISSPTIPFSLFPRPSLATLPTTICSSSLMGQGRRTLSHRLVRECCENGYQLLINSFGNGQKVQAIFGKQLNTSERNLMISEFYAALHSEPWDMIELRTKVLGIFHSKRNTDSPEQLAISPQTRQTDNEYAYDEWLDASEVQTFLLEKGIQILDTRSPGSSPRFTSSSRLNAVAFIRRELSKANICVSIINMTTVLSLSPICVGRGPAFRKQDVENALRHANLEGPYSFDIYM
ncbi:hypothetical protein CNMCM5878_004155 [Aspergillus fumigatiaffinis]|nr:hypothetical protein CNMCM5878_004155 [Aspergillus fumigatiaffinis]